LYVCTKKETKENKEMILKLKIAYNQKPTA